MPLHEPRASHAAFAKYHTTSHRKTRALARAVSIAFGGPLGERMFRDRLVVGIDPRIPRTEWSQWLLLCHLGDVLRVPHLVPFVSVRRSVPNTKPTLRLFDGAGEPQGFAKVGWSAATRDVVRNEVRALREVGDRLSRLRVPQLIAAGDWLDQEYAITSQLPRGVRAWHANPSTTPEILLDIAKSGQVSHCPLVGSSFSRRVAEDLETATPSEPIASSHLLAWLRRLERRSDLLHFGRWHGDWVRWNLGQTAAGPIAWDWEYSDPDVPVGFDLLHWHFQQSLARKNSQLGDAIRDVRSAAPALATLGVATAGLDLVVGLFLLETFTRATRMAAAGAGWNSKIFPAMMGVDLMPDVS